LQRRRGLRRVAVQEVGVGACVFRFEQVFLNGAGVVQVIGARIDEGVSVLRCSVLRLLLKQLSVENVLRLRLLVLSKVVQSGFSRSERKGRLQPQDGSNI